MMPGSTTSPTDPTKAKVTSATNGVFVRPVAVAGIFRPVQEDPSKPPALPEKRRFSALVGELRPCSSGEGPGSDDFNRRRQSWDTRQKEVPFGQALLRRTPRNIPTKPDAQTVKSDGVRNGSVASEASPGASDPVKIETTVKRSDSVKTEQLSKPASSLPSTAIFPAKKDDPPVDAAKRNDKELKSNGHDASAKCQIQTTEFSISKENKSNSITVLDVNKSSHENHTETKTTTTTADSTKQTKKVYGLAKRESKTENTQVKSDLTTNSSSDAAAYTKNPPPKTKVYGLRTSVKKESEAGKEEKQLEVIEPTPKVSFTTNTESKNEINSTVTSESKIAVDSPKLGNDIRVSKSPPKDFRTVRRTSDVIAARIQNIFSNFQSEKPAPPVLKKTKIPGKASGSVNTESTPTIGNETEKKNLNSVVPTISPAPCVSNVITSVSASVINSKAAIEQEKKSPVSEDSKIVSKDQNLNTLTSTKSPVSGVSKSVSKDQNLNTKTSTASPVSEVSKSVSKDQNLSTKTSTTSTVSEVSKSVSKDQDLSTKTSTTSTVSEVSKSVSKDQNLNAKTSTKKPANEVASLNVEKLSSIKSGDRLGSKGAETSNVQGVKSELPLKKADSKTEHSINAASSKPGDKKIADIEGKMPIKKEDQSSSDGTKTFKAANQETDRKSSDQTTTSNTVVLSVNKGAGAKKMFSVRNNIAEVSDLKSSNAIVPSHSVNGTVDSKKEEVKSIKQVNVSEGKLETKSVEKITSVCSTVSSQSFVATNSVHLRSAVSNKFVNGNHETTEISKVEIAKITPSTTPGIVPTVNVLFRTKSPSGPPNRDENRKKVLIETCSSDTPISSAVIISPQITNVIPSDISQSVKEVLKTVESAKQTPDSPKLPKKHAILNLQKQEVLSVDLSSNGTAKKPSIDNSKIETKVASNSKQNIDVDPKVVTTTTSTSLNMLPTELSSDTVAQSKTEGESTKTFTTSKSTINDDGIRRIEISTYSSASSLDTKSSVLDLGDWSKKFQLPEPDVPRAPLRRRALRDSMPPSLPLRSPSRFGSLKRIDDTSRYIPRSPSHSSLPQRYSYTEMLSKVCSMGVLPYVEPGMSKSCSSSSSQVSELWSELSEEQSNATHASEMLEAETTERMRLEKEVHELQGRYSQVQQRSNKMEMEILESKVYRSPEINGDLSEDEDPDGTGSLYKQKYERAVRDMEIMKRRIQQQHEEEMEQKSMLKKATDKRLAEALEDVDEERQVANQWKRKAQKSAAELQDIRLMLEEQMGRNGELEKKQRRFDAELSAAQEEIKKERLLREKLMREKDQAVNEKYSLDQELQSAKLDSDMLHEKITQLNRELDELTLSSRGEEEVTQLKRAKQELERKNRDQEEELEELTAQVQMLEQAKLRLEMSLEKVRQEHRREASVREEEIEEIRASFSKKIKNLEAQLESEQDERHQLVKQKHELERRIYELTDQPPPQDPEIERRLRRDLKRTKALLRDAQSMLEHTREGQSSKTLIRQLKNQLEDSEFAKATAIKARQAIETELQECQLQLEEVSRTKNEAETRCLQLSREKSAIQTQLEEAEEEMAEVMKKYKAVVAQMSTDQKTLAELNQQIAELETERQMLKDQLSEVSHKFEHLAGQSDDTHKMHWLDGKVRDLESKLELEQTTKTRLENQIARLKEQNDRAREECDSLRNKELQAQEAVRRLQRQIRDLREDYSSLQQKEADGYRKQHELEMALENTETDLQVTKNDLRLACQRIQDLQNALEDDLDSGTDVPDDSGSDSDTSFELSVLRNQSLTPIQRCESIASNLSYDTAEGPRSRTSSFTRELSAFSRMMLKRTSMDYLG